MYCRNLCRKYYVVWRFTKPGRFSSNYRGLRILHSAVEISLSFGSIRATHDKGTDKPEVGLTWSVSYWKHTAKCGRMTFQYIYVQLEHCMNKQCELKQNTLYCTDLHTGFRCCSRCHFPSGADVSCVVKRLWSISLPSAFQSDLRQPCIWNCLLCMSVRGWQHSQSTTSTSACAGGAFSKASPRCRRTSGASCRSPLTCSCFFFFLSVLVCLSFLLPSWRRIILESMFAEKQACALFILFFLLHVIADFSFLIVLTRTEEACGVEKKKNGKEIRTSVSLVCEHVSRQLYTVDTFTFSSTFSWLAMSSCQWGCSIVSFLFFLLLVVFEWREEMTRERARNVRAM